MAFKMLRLFSFFGNKLSRKAGQKCCIYGQDGKPLTPEFVSLKLNEMGETVKYWKPNAEFTQLTHLWYVKDYFEATAFICEVARTDSMNVVKQKPTVYLRKDLLKIELSTPSLGGLSHADLSLAVQITLLGLPIANLVAVSDEKNFRRELRLNSTESNS
jgi:pterin-4a-carbinolamine dehydratase